MESKLFKRLRRATPGFHWQRHEDKYASGIPDASFGYMKKGGWVELKTYDRPPRDPQSPVKFSDLKPEQVNWIMARGRAQGRCWILVEVGSEWFLISWQHARKLGTLTLEEIREISSQWGSKSLKGINKTLIRLDQG